MTQQAEIYKEIDTLPSRYFGDVLNFIGYLQIKAKQEAAARELRNAREKAAFEKYADELNREMEDVLLDQDD